MHTDALRRGIWLLWTVLAVLAVTAPFNPLLNRPVILFPFFLVSGVVGLGGLAIAMRLEYGGRR